MRLIDADAYKKYLDENWIVANYDAIDAQPTIDAEPVRRGKWEVLFYDNIPQIAKCSECGEVLFFTEEEYPRHISNYCPNCGARMDGERRTDE